MSRSSVCCHQIFWKLAVAKCELITALCQNLTFVLLEHCNPSPPIPIGCKNNTMATMLTNDGGVFAEWTALVRRERMVAYHMSPAKAKQALPGTSPTSSAVDLMMEEYDDSISLPCPSAWREKIVEWCFQVVDHW